MAITDYAGCINCWNSVLDGDENCPCDDCDQQEGIVGAGTAPSLWVPDSDELARQFTQDPDATVESIKIAKGLA